MTFKNLIPIHQVTCTLTSVIANGTMTGGTDSSGVAPDSTGSGVEPESSGSGVEPESSLSGVEAMKLNENEYVLFNSGNGGGSQLNRCIFNGHN